jgi:tetratricopeptide (TPR) repeat protein
VHEGDTLVNEIKFQLVDSRGKPRGFITKANLAVLDLLNNMDWNRPVYFAVTTGGDAYMGLEQYFQLEGLAYRLTPIKHKKNENPNLDGGVGTDIMYHNMMNKFQWGNMDSKKIYMDENNRRMTTNLRLQFGHLAQQLIDEGKLDSAKKVLYKSLDVMPEYNVPYEQPQIMWQVVNLLFDAGDKEAGLALTKRLIQLNNQSLDYYHSLDERHQVLIESDITMRVQINDRLAVIAKQNFPDDAEVQAILDEVALQREEFELPSYEEYLQQEQEMKRMKKTQDSIMQLQRKQGVNVSLEGPTGIIRK